MQRKKDDGEAFLNGGEHRLPRWRTMRNGDKENRSSTKLTTETATTRNTNGNDEDQ
ncbi:hypothetical protein SESBI_31420 [Sesbania bispinosa]|nr:hypothetical protein SESBI_31420 [Sesbania bispinosa]